MTLRSRRALPRHGEQEIEADGWVHLGVWHRVANVSELDESAQTWCGYRINNAGRADNKPAQWRPDPTDDVVCRRCMR